MKKSAFTLIEVMISVTLLVIIMLFLTSSSATLKKGYELLSKKEEKNLNRFKVTELLYYDFLQSSIINITPSKYYDTIHLKTKSTLFQKDEPFVSYTVIKRNNTLIRMESDHNITLPIHNDDVYKIEYINVLEDVEEFKINLPNVEDNTTAIDKLILSIFPKNKTPIIFELGLINSVEIKVKSSS